MSKTSVYYKALLKSLSIANASRPSDSLNGVVRATAQAMGLAASFLGLDSLHTHLVHQVSWGLPQPYLKKGPLDAGKSLGEVSTGEPVVINDVASDSRVEYPDLALKAGIHSILGIPVLTDDGVLGSLRLYSRAPHTFSRREIEFALTMARLIAVVAGASEGGARPEKSGKALHKIQRAELVNFAHPSEYDFARLLDFYAIEWFYEPRSFPLQWEKGQAMERFTPDFYLPGLDLYVELTTMKQNLVTAKNRKLRRLRELYPEVQIILLYKNDYDRLFARYSSGPLAQTRAHGISRVLYSAAEIDKRVKELAYQISQDYSSLRPVMVGVQRGFLCFMADLIRQITIPLDIDFMATSYYNSNSSAIKVTKDLDLNITGRPVLIIEDIIDTGITLNYIINHLKSKNPAEIAICTLLSRKTRRLVSLPLRYIGFDAPDEFLVGYGLDYHEEYRNLPFIGIPTLERVGGPEEEERG